MATLCKYLVSSLAVSYFLCIFSTPGYGAQSTRSVMKYNSNQVIVRFRPGAAEFSKTMIRSRVSGTRLKAYRIFDGLELHRLPTSISVEEAIAIYQQDPDVLYAEPNYIVHTTNTPNDTRFGELWGLHNIGQSGGTPDADIDAPSAWDFTTGSSDVVVAVLDTGIDYNHPDLSANMFRNNADCNNGPHDDDGNGYVNDCHGIDVANNDSDPLDDHNHGTHVAGTIGAVGNNNNGVTGINWNVGLMACKFFDASGNGTTADAVTCLEYVKAMKDRGVNVVATNNSWGGGDFSQALYDAIQAHLNSGILFITAAGNGTPFFGFPINNDQTPFYPCTYDLPNIICVAATTRTDDRAFFSNYGRRTVHIGAPGYEILSTTRNNTYATQNGTSMATPHVAGVAALLKARNQSWDWRAIRNLILAGGDNIASMANTISQKRLNAFGAMTCDNSTLFSRLSPIADTILGDVDTPVNLSVLNINCAVPNGNVDVTINPGGQTLTLLDNGAGSDHAANDGVYSAVWSPPTTGNFTLTFPDGSVLTVSVSTPTISVSPSSLDFGGVNVGASMDRTLTVSNVGSGSLIGSATSNAPFAIVSGGSYNLGANQSQTVTVRFSPITTGTFAGNISLTGGGDASVSVVGTSPEVSAISPNPIDLAAPPASFTITGVGFVNLGFGLPVANFYSGSSLVAQARATAGTDTNLTVPYPTNATSLSGPLAGLRAGTITVKVYNQTGANSWSLLGSTSLTVNDTRSAPGVNSISPNPIDLAAPPASFTITGGEFANLGFGLPVANFTRNGTVIAQARATSGTSTILTVPYPTDPVSVPGPLPGLSAGTVIVKVYNQTGSNSWSLLGSTSLTVNDTRPAPGVSAISPNPIDLAAPPASFTITGGGFANLGFGLPVANFYSGSSFVAQARATAGTDTNLTVPYPTNATSLSGPLAGLRAGTITVKVYNQTGANSWSLLGSTSLTVNDTRSAPGVNSISPNPIDLAAPPASFTITGGGFANLGFGLPVANFYSGSSFVAQARATAGTDTNLTVPYPTNATSLSGPLAGLRAGTITVKVYNQTGANSWSLLGSTSLTVNDTR